jgi:hypothetical protein
MLRPLCLGLIVITLCAATTRAQVHYHADGQPWRQRAQSGPDAEVPGWFYNLGVTGLRVELVADAPTHLVVRHVFADTPAADLVRVGDHIVGAGARPFATPHRNGYGKEVFGAVGPIADFADALDAALATAGKGRLKLMLERDGKPSVVTLQLDPSIRPFGPNFPAACKESSRVLDGLLDWLGKEQRDDGSWGSPPHDLFAPLALLASGEARFAKSVRKAARFHAENTRAKDHASLINWTYTAAGIFLAEYYLATKEDWVLPELEEIQTFLLHSQYTDPAQVNPNVKETHPDSWPKLPTDSIGGWGHNPGFEGYGPIAMITGQGALVFALMQRCGLEVDRERHDAAYDFLARGTGRNGYVWYGDEVADPTGWADMGRTGACGIANWLSPWPGASYRERALANARIIGEHPESFPDTHGSPTMGMAFAALAANVDAPSFERLMQSNRWWFTLARCPDGTFYYQPNRDNAGYGGDSRLSASAVVAFILSIPKRSLHSTGKPLAK